MAVSASRSVARIRHCFGGRGRYWRRQRRSRQWICKFAGVGVGAGVLLPYSRLQESEADRPGMMFMAEAGNGPYAARDLWARMARKGKGKPLEILSSRSADTTRIEQIEKWISDALQNYRPSS
jgi:predicted Zn-dependent protease